MSTDGKEKACSGDKEVNFEESEDERRSGRDDQICEKKSERASRKVSFPEDDQLVTQYFEPANPWQDVPPINRAQVAAEYLECCRRHNTPPLDTVLRQIRELPETCLGGGCRAPRLTLDGCTLSGAAPLDALEAVLRRAQFRRLDIEHSHIDDEAAEALFDMVEYYESASILSINGPRAFGIRGWQACSRMIKKSSQLAELEISNHPLESNHAPVLARALHTHTCRLRVLCLQRAGLAGDPTLCLVIALKSNNSIRELRLGENGLGVSDAAQIASLLRYNTRIQLLDLSNNQIQDAGCGHIADALADQNPRSPPLASPPANTETRGLAFLVLWNNQLTRNCASHLSKALMSQSLCVLNVGRNALGGECVRALGGGGGLLSLGLQAARLGPDAGRALHDLIAATQLQRLDLRENKLGGAALSAILAALQHNNTLTQIDLDDPPKQESTTTLTTEESESALVARLTVEIRVRCREQEPPACPPRAAPLSRKISLTCHSHPPPPTTRIQSPGSGSGSVNGSSPSSVGSVGSVGSGQMSPMEERRCTRLRSPLPSPAGSPVPPPSRFSVTRVTPERELSGSTLSPLSPSPSSRFKVVQVAEPPQIQVSPAGGRGSRFSVTRNYDTMYQTAPPSPPAPPTPSAPQPSPAVVATSVTSQPVAATSMTSQPLAATPVPANPQAATSVTVTVVAAPPVAATSLAETPLAVTPLVATSVTSYPGSTSLVTAQPLAATPVPANRQAATSVPVTVVAAPPVTSHTVAATPLAVTPLVATSVTSYPGSTSLVTAQPVAAIPMTSQPLAATPVPANPQAATSVPVTPVFAPPVTSHTVTATPLAVTPLVATSVTSYPGSTSLVTSKPVTANPMTSQPLAATTGVANPQAATSVPVTVVAAPPVTSHTLAATPLAVTPMAATSVTSYPGSTSLVTSQPVTATPMTSSAVSTTRVKASHVSTTPMTSCAVSTTPLSSHPMSTAIVNSTVSCLPNRDTLCNIVDENSAPKDIKLDVVNITSEKDTENLNSASKNETIPISASKNDTISAEDAKNSNGGRKVDKISATDTNNSVNSDKSTQSDVYKDKSEEISHCESVDVDKGEKVLKTETKLVKNTVEKSVSEKVDVEVQVTVKTESKPDLKGDQIINQENQEHEKGKDPMKQIEAITEDLGNLIREMKDLSTKTKKAIDEVEVKIDVPANIIHNVVLKKNKSESSLDSPDLEVSRLMNTKLEGSATFFCDSSSSLEISGSSMESLAEPTVQAKPIIIQESVDSDIECDRRNLDRVVLSTESSLESNTSEMTPVNSNFLNTSVSSNESVSPIFGITKKIHDSLSSLEASVSSLDSKDRLMVTSADSGIEYSLQHPTENKEDNSSNEGTLTNNSSLKETVRKSDGSQFQVQDTLTTHKRTASLLDVPSLKSKGLERMRKISWVAPSSSYHIPKPEPEKIEPKLPSHLDKLLSLFQHPTSLFSRGSEDDKKSTSSVSIRKDTSLTSSFWSWGSTTEKEKEEDSSEATDSTLSERNQVSFVDESFSKKLDSKTPSTDTENTENTLSEFQSLPTQGNSETSDVSQTDKIDRVTELTTDNIVQKSLDVSVNFTEDESSDGNKDPGACDSTDLIQPNDLNKNNPDTAIKENTPIKEKDSKEEIKEVVRPRTFAAVLSSSSSENSLDKQTSPEGQPVDKLPSKVIRGIKENISPENTLTSSATNIKALVTELAERQFKNQPVVSTVWDRAYSLVESEEARAPIATIEETCDESVDLSISSAPIEFIDDLKFIDEKNLSADSGVTSLEGVEDKKDVKKELEAVDLGKDALSYLIYENQDFEPEPEQNIPNVSQEGSLAQELKDAENKDKLIDLSPELVIDEAIEVPEVFVAKDLKGLCTSPVVPERAKLKKSNSLEDLSHSDDSPKTKTIAFKIPETTPRDIPQKRGKLCSRSGSSPKSLPESLNRPVPDNFTSKKKKKKVSSLGKIAKDSLLQLNMSEEEIAEFRRSYKLTSVESLKSLESVSEDANSQSGTSADSRCRACLRMSQESLMSLDSITEDCKCTDNCDKADKLARSVR